MATENLEQKVENLQKVVEKLQNEVELLQAVHEIQNVMAKYYHIHGDTGQRQSPELFALKQPDVSVEIAMWGVYIGADHIRKMYGGMEDEGEREHTPMPGGAIEHNLTTPVIQVAADGKTAKGVWFSPGYETRPTGPGGKLQAEWNWARVGTDFIKEDGKWKIWHYHFYDTFMTPYNVSWVDQPQPAIGEKQHADADKPPTSRSTYFPDQVRKWLPKCPEPYETWDGKSVA